MIGYHMFIFFSKFFLFCFFAFELSLFILELAAYGVNPGLNLELYRQLFAGGAEQQQQLLAASTDPTLAVSCASFFV